MCGAGVAGASVAGRLAALTLEPPVLAHVCLIALCDMAEAGHQVVQQDMAQHLVFVCV